MITIIHGDDTASSRIYFKSLVKTNKILDGETVMLGDVLQVLSSDGLFHEEKTIGIENFFSKRKASKEMTKILESIKSFESTHTIVFWEGKPLTKKVDSHFTNPTIKPYIFPKSLFQFLDSLTPNNKSLIPLFHETKKYTEEELIFFMLIRQFRLLIALSTDSEAAIDETRRLAPWQRKKLISQAKRFSPKDLASLYHKLYLMDLNLKTGQTPTSLTEQIDFFLSQL